MRGIGIGLLGSALAAALAAGCNGGSPSGAGSRAANGAGGGVGGGSGQGTVVASITDQPFLAGCFAEASVTIDEIILIPTGFTGTIPTGGTTGTTPAGATQTGTTTGAPTGATLTTLRQNARSPGALNLTPQSPFPTQGPITPGTQPTATQFPQTPSSPPIPTFPGGPSAVTVTPINTVPGGAATGTPSGTGAAATPVVLTTTAGTFNLLDLVGGVTETAAIASAPAGSYSTVRLVLSGGVVTWTDGFQLTFPLATATAIDVPALEPIIVAPGGVTNLIIDFDVGASFARAVGAGLTCDTLKIPGALQFTPTARAFEEAAVGRLGGTVRDGRTGETLAGAIVTAAMTTGVNGAGAGAGGTTGTGAGTTGNGGAGAGATGTGTAGSGAPTGTGTTGIGGATQFSTLSSAGAGGAAVGSYALFLPPGDYEVTAEVEGRTPVTLPVTVGAGGSEAGLDLTIP